MEYVYDGNPVGTGDRNRVKYSEVELKRAERRMARESKRRRKWRIKSYYKQSSTTSMFFGLDGANLVLEYHQK